jgi:cation diffusion facilitator family transporter
MRFLHSLYPLKLHNLLVAFSEVIVKLLRAPLHQDSSAIRNQREHGQPNEDGDEDGTDGVIISAILMQMFGWFIADPICSIFIAILIGLSVFSLISDSAAILMQRSPKQLDDNLTECYQKVMQLEGVQGVQETHFWTLCSDYYCGGLKLEVSANADAKYIVSHTQMIFRAVGITQLYVQLDFEYGQNTYRNLQNLNNGQANVAYVR